MRNYFKPASQMQGPLDFNRIKAWHDLWYIVHEVLHTVDSTIPPYTESSCFKLIAADIPWRKEYHPNPEKKETKLYFNEQKELMASCRNGLVYHLSSIFKYSFLDYFMFDAGHNAQEAAPSGFEHDREQEKLLQACAKLLGVPHEVNSKLAINKNAACPTYVAESYVQVLYANVGSEVFNAVLRGLSVDFDRIISDHYDDEDNMDSFVNVKNPDHGKIVFIDILLLISSVNKGYRPDLAVESNGANLLVRKDVHLPREKKMEFRHEDMVAQWEAVLSTSTNEDSFETNGQETSRLYFSNPGFVLFQNTDDTDDTDEQEVMLPPGFFQRVGEALQSISGLAVSDVYCSYGYEIECAMAKVWGKLKKPYNHYPDPVFGVPHGMHAIAHHVRLACYFDACTRYLANHGVTEVKELCQSFTHETRALAIVALLTSRVGRESEDSRSENKELYDSYLRSSAVYFKSIVKACLGYCHAFTEKLVAMFSFVIEHLQKEEFCELLKSKVAYSSKEKSMMLQLNNLFVLIRNLDLKRCLNERCIENLLAPYSGKKPTGSLVIGNKDQLKEFAQLKKYVGLCLYLTGSVFDDWNEEKFRAADNPKRCMTLCSKALFEVYFSCHEKDTNNLMVLMQAAKKKRSLLRGEGQLILSPAGLPSAHKL